MLWRSERQTPDVKQSALQYVVLTFTVIRPRGSMNPLWLPCQLLHLTGHSLERNVCCTGLGDIQIGNVSVPSLLTIVGHAWEMIIPGSGRNSRERTDRPLRFGGLLWDPCSQHVPQSNIESVLQSKYSVWHCVNNSHWPQKSYSNPLRNSITSPEAFHGTLWEIRYTKDQITSSFLNRLFNFNLNW